MNDWRADARYEYDGVNKQGFLIAREKEQSKFMFKSVRALLFPERSFLKSHSQAYMFLRDRFKDLFMKARLMDIPGIEYYKKNGSFQARFSHTRNSFLTILINAYKISIEEYAWLQPQSALREFCIANNIDYLDLRGAFNKAERDESMYFDVDSYWNRKGHLLVAKELYRLISDRYR